MKKDISTVSNINSIETKPLEKTSVWAKFKNKTKETYNKAKNYFKRYVSPKGKQLWNFCKVVSRLLTGAMLWEAVGYLAPSLKEKAPSFFQVTDLLISWVELLFNWICDLLGLV